MEQPSKVVDQASFWFPWLAAAQAGCRRSR